MGRGGKDEEEEKDAADPYAEGNDVNPLIDRLEKNQEPHLGE